MLIRIVTAFTEVLLGDKHWCNQYIVVGSKGYKINDTVVTEIQIDSGSKIT